MHHLILMLSCLAQLMEAYTYKPARTVTLTEGQSATFTCLVYPEIWRSGRVQAYYAKYDKYLCRDPCGPHDWHLIVATTDKTIAPNRNPRFTITKLPNSNGVQITISYVKPTDAGTYWCGIEYPSSDMYRQLTVIVNGPPDPHDALLNMLSDVNTVMLTSLIEDNHSGDYENITNIIKHMKDAIQLPPVINYSWFPWLKSLDQGWPAWFLTIIPYVMIFLLLCTLIPYVLKCLSNVLMKKMTHSSTYVQVNANNADQNSNSPHIPDPGILPQLRL